MTSNSVLNTKVLYFGVYDPQYSRNRVLIKGLKQNEVDVLECAVKSRSKVGYLKSVLKYLTMWPRFDVMIVGFPGQEMMFLARLLTKKLIIFDAFTSHYGGYILDRQYFSETSMRARYYKFLDTWSCKLADLVLLDTQAHIDFFIKEFNLPREKFLRIFVGTDTDIFYPREHKKENDSFTVHFHGSYNPLQGVEHIIKAAKLLKDENIIFNLIGTGQTHEKNRKLAQELQVKNINFIAPVTYSDLPSYIAQADIALGIFGDSVKTELVIPNKIFEAIAMKKAVISSDTGAVHELFRDKENILLCRKADAIDLAEKILILKNDTLLRDAIAQGAYDLFRHALTEDIIGKTLAASIHERRSL